MLRATDERWKSRFGRFVSSFGSTNLADHLEVDRSNVFKWIRGSSAPDPGKALAICDLASSSGFRLSLEDVYANFRRRVRVQVVPRKAPGANKGEKPSLA
jgi:hypothetical protein